MANKNTNEFLANVLMKADVNKCTHILAVLSYLELVLPCQVFSCFDKVIILVIMLQPCRTFLQSTDVQFMFTEMITKSQQQFLV